MDSLSLHFTHYFVTLSTSFLSREREFSRKPITSPRTCPNPRRKLLPSRQGQRKKLSWTSISTWKVRGRWIRSPLSPTPCLPLSSRPPNSLTLLSGLSVTVTTRTSSPNVLTQLSLTALDCFPVSFSSCSMFLEGLCLMCLIGFCCFL